MAYRGDDLDLRTPQTWSLPTDIPGGLQSGPDAPANGRSRQHAARAILVDDIVLACCNHAFDVASAHRAIEVRIEHLLHAMTRIDTATSALEARGVRVAGMRRESATIIASEIPIGLGGGLTRPRRSDDLEAALRQASAFAARRNGPASIEDVIDALLEMPADVPGISLLARHGGRGARERVPGQLREALPLPPLTLTGLGGEPKPDGDRRSRSYSARPEPRSEWPRGDLNREAGLGSTTDSIQNVRIEQLETAVRALTAELASERNAISGLVQDLQHNLIAERDDTSRFRGGLDNRLSALEHALLESRGGDDSAARLFERLTLLEQGLVQQVAELSRPWSILSDRLQALEQTILDTRHSRAVDLSPIHDRLIGLERTIRETTADSGRQQSTLVDRLKTIERAIETGAGKPAELDAIAARLDIIEEAVLSVDSSKTNEPVIERIRSLEAAFGEQRNVVQQATGGLAADVKSLASALAAQSGSADRVQSMVSERLQALAAGFERQRADVLNGMAERMGSFADALDQRIQTATAPVGERLASVANAFEGRLQSATQPLSEKFASLEGRLQTVLNTLDGRVGQALAPMIGRLQSLEALLAASAEQTRELEAQHASELKEVHDALLKLNTNQVTLAGSIDQWRLDGVGDITAVASRLESIEKASVQPTEMLAHLTTSVDNIGKATVERYHRRNRFWYWLFGTDDWLSASWPSQIAAVESERQALRGATGRSARTLTPPR